MAEPSPTTSPLLFTAPKWVAPEVAQAYSDSLSDLMDEGTLTGIDKLIAVEFIDLDDGTYVLEIQFVYDYSSNPCRGSSFQAQALFTKIMRTVPYDFGDYKLDDLRLLARAPGVDAYGNPGWLTVSGTELLRKTFSKVNWETKDIEFLINWDELSESRPCTN